MTSLPFEVLQYSFERLLDVLARNAAFSVADYRKKDVHAVFLEEYLRDIGVQTLLLEPHYVDQHYLEDYAGYYAHCFPKYEKYCSRVHFFSKSFSKKAFIQLIGGTGGLTAKALQAAYQGFLVIKPLPKTVIGRTCLASYPENPRFYPIRRIYNANLFGLDLNIMSLAYQEQDRAAAACSSSALWSVFQGTGALFQHEIPSPFKITSIATQVSSPAIEISGNLSVQTRNFPSKGLSMFQMAQAVRHVGLEPFSVNVQNTFVLRNTLYSYLRAKIPLLLMLEIRKEHDDSFVGRHAVAITGYKLHQDSVTDLSTNFVTVGNRIERFYAHDDQVGPFARMVIQPTGRLSTSYGGSGSHSAIPELVLVPLIGSVRIQAETISDLAREVDTFIEQARLSTSLEISSDRLEWDIYLVSIQELKSDIIKMKTVSVKHKLELLTRSFPLYLWRAVALQDGEPLFELLFDSTDLEQADGLLDVIVHDEQVFDNLIRAINNILKIPVFRDSLRTQVVTTLETIAKHRA